MVAGEFDGCFGVGVGSVVVVVVEDFKADVTGRFLLPVLLISQICQIHIRERVEKSLPLLLSWQGDVV